MQAVVKLALEPEWETRFEANSYGFRPGRCTMDAIEAIFIALGQKGSSRWIFDADISGCFDAIAHKPLLAKLPTFTRTIERWLKAGSIDMGAWQRQRGGYATGRDSRPPPTILQNSAGSVRGVGAGWVMRWLGAKDDVHVLPVDLNPLHQQTDQLAALLPIRCSETILNSFGKLFEPPDDERQGAPLCGFVTHGIGLRLPSLDPLSKACKPRFELPPFNQAFGVAVDQSVHAAPELGKLQFDRSEIGAWFTALRCGKPPLVLGRNALWIPQYTLDLLPDSFVQPVRADLLVRAHTLTAEPISVATAAPVICIIRRLPFPAHRLTGLP